jgi:hypothetical protein
LLAATRNQYFTPLSSPVTALHHSRRNHFALAEVCGLFCNMAWRTHDNVTGDEIDNRMKGRVRGELRLDGLGEPVKLDLAGNACPDLAGCLLKFKNPAKILRIRRKAEFNPLQRGKIGSLWASQKVRALTIPDEKAFSLPAPPKSVSRDAKPKPLPRVS